MTCTFSISDLWLTVVETLSFGIGSTIWFTSALAVVARSALTIESAKANHRAAGDDDPIVPPNRRGSI